MPLSDEQRSWLKGFGEIVGGAGQDPDDDGDDQDDGDAGDRGQRPKLRLRPQRGAFQAVAGQGAQDDEQATSTGSEGVRLGFGPEDILPIIPGVIDELTERRATCAIHNNTQTTLTLDTASLDETDDESGKTPGIIHGKYIEFPPSQVPVNDQSKRFGAQNNKLGPFSTTGVECVVKYVLDPQGTAWILHFENSFNSGNSVQSRVEGPNAAQFDAPKPGMGGKNDVKYLFILNAKGGTGPTPPPGPTPPATNVVSSCQITVENKSAFVLTRLEAEHEIGDFSSPPPREMQPGQVITFGSTETAGATEQGCKGYIVWQVGTPMVAIWRIEWNNPEGQKNDAKGTVSPPTVGFLSQDIISQGDADVQAGFTLSGGPAAPGPGPMPPPGPTPPPPPPGPEPDFVPPPESKQPTLRKGDESDDGWVEYAQYLLKQGGAKLERNGIFDAAMEAAVRGHQQDNGLLVDGIIGNQTWASLRQDKPEAPSTDGREPGTFEEQGAEARWTIESEFNNRYYASRDEFHLAVDSVGDTPLDPKTEATIRITPPGAASHTTRAPLGSMNSKGFHQVTVKGFRKLAPSLPPDAPVTEYLVEAYLPEDLGGDFYSANVRAAEDAPEPQDSNEPSDAGGNDSKGGKGGKGDKPGQGSK